MPAFLLAFLPGFGTLKKWALILGGGALALSIAFGAGWLTAKMDARAERKIRELEAQKRALEFDLSAAKKAADLAFKQTKYQEAETLSLEQKVASYEAELASRPDDRCALSDDDIGRLRNIIP